MEPLKVFKALGHEFRFQVFEALLEGKIHSCCGEIRSYEQGCCVTDLTDRFEMSQSTISHHLSILVDSGIVKMEKRGLWSVYLIVPEAIAGLHSLLGEWTTKATNTETVLHKVADSSQDEHQLPESS